MKYHIPNMNKETNPLGTRHLWDALPEFFSDRKKTSDCSANIMAKANDITPEPNMTLFQWAEQHGILDHLAQSNAMGNETVPPEEFDEEQWEKEQTENVLPEDMIRKDAEDFNENCTRWEQEQWVDPDIPVCPIDNSKGYSNPWNELTEEEHRQMYEEWDKNDEAIDR